MGSSSCSSSVAGTLSVASTTTSIGPSSSELVSSVCSHGHSSYSPAASTPSSAVASPTSTSVLTSVLPCVMSSPSTTSLPTSAVSAPVPIGASVPTSGPCSPSPSSDSASLPCSAVATVVDSDAAAAAPATLRYGNLLDNLRGQSSPPASSMVGTNATPPSPSINPLPPSPEPVVPDVSSIDPTYREDTPRRCSPVSPTSLEVALRRLFDAWRTARSLLPPSSTPAAVTETSSSSCSSAVDRALSSVAAAWAIERRHVHENGIFSRSGAGDRHVLCPNGVLNLSVSSDQRCCS
ncbi:hypothetical protein CF327_g4928 [Tilletia walkeri]|nr:hypothetical protein CF327_g4928 [Tilletia walkeri]